MSLHFANVAMNLDIKVPYEALQRHLPASPDVVGGELAMAVHHYAKKHSLGYYPALAFFSDQGGIDRDLLNAAENIAWLASEMVCNEVRLRLRPVFSNIRFESVQTVAFTMPRVRMGQGNGLTSLAAHFTPDVIKLNMITTLLQKQENHAAAERLAKGILSRWLNNRFEKLDINSITAIDEV